MAGGPSTAAGAAVFRMPRGRFAYQPYRLRAADALQLAAAIVAADFNAASMPFVTLDVRLAEAADREGFRMFGVDRG